MDTANNQHGEGETTFEHLSNLKRLTYFVAVVEAGSFTQAAERLGITKAVVSQQVARLEAEFRTTLLTRTTRKVLPTQAGLEFYGRCAAILREAGAAFNALSETAAEPTGTLRLTAPVDYGISVVVPTIAAYMARYPACRVDAMLSDQRVDLAANNLELAIRAGRLSQPDMQARQIGSSRQLLVAAPDLLDRMGRPHKPDDLATFPFVANTALRESCRWQFAREGETPCSVTFTASVSLDATQAVKEAVRQGLGLSVLPDFALADELGEGRLVHVLPEWELPRSVMHAVFPFARYRPAKVRAFVELLEENARRLEEAIANATPARRA
jgi:DNA-binding transcriptional LysR family regulator